MKIQDAIFFVVFVSALVFRRPKILLTAGLLCWMTAIPLFTFWVFFTAERLTWYGSAFIFAFILISLIRPNAVK